MFLRKWMKRREQVPKVEYDDTRLFNIAPMPDLIKRYAEPMNFEKAVYYFEKAIPEKDYHGNS